MRWQVQEAKQRFSEVLRAAEGEPQIVTKHGQEIAVVLDIDEYRRLRGEPVGFMSYLRADAVAGDEFTVERSRELPREIDLGE
ncbi:antitoxin [Catellatospora sp. TT07R-123]|uniref:type II toxin-antitoxin system Phd/YefM family antitoxin n=1 Tax=Catellatospora sp. TT07R-123 TaxID=2733863 RepID=UPI001B0F4857|nr:type II toxin-antitoxin system Phd/YefM family antitoxin [Catellatospora sp. TT07R-123]GHJ49282.1 antitoxin [Catellatospora sp. TT07R-123]